MWTYPDHKYYSGYYIKGTFDIEIYTNRTAISVAYYINKGETLSKEQEQEIRESQIQLTELIIRELKLL